MYIFETVRHFLHKLIEPDNKVDRDKHREPEVRYLFDCADYIHNLIEIRDD